MTNEKLKKNYLNKQNISLFIFLFVNFIFSVKYLNRVTNYYLFISVAIVGFYLCLWECRKILDRFTPYLGKINIFIILLFVITSFIIFSKVHVESLNVDRWSVIASFWDNYFKGEYVYFAKSNVGNPPGPMPFYFILALPFYLIGELGYFSILSIIVFYILIKKTKIDIQIQTTAMLLVSGSVFYLWEVACRSNIFLNGTLVLITLFYFLDLKILSTKNIVISGILIGLIISTRNVFVIPFIIAFIFLFKNNKINFKQVVVLGLISLITFALTFLPFVWNYFEDFKIVNPFIIQSTFLVPFQYTLLFIGLSVIVGFLCKTKEDVYFYSGLILFISICIYFTYHFIKVGFFESFFESFADISYFIFCIPFSLYYLLIKKQNLEE